MKNHWQLIFVILMAVCSTQCIPKGNHTFVSAEQMKNIYSQIDIPSDFTEIDSHSTTRQESSVSSHFYKSSVSYSKVKDYFEASLTSKNWVYHKEEAFESISATEIRKRFGYKKAECILWVEYQGLSQSNGWNYGISLVC